MKIAPKIMLKVAAKEQENKDLNRCLETRICPKCGGDLKSELFMESDGSGIEFECLSCGFKYVR